MIESSTRVPLTTRERQRQDTRSRVLAAAVDEISARGLAGAQISDIAEAAGVSRPTVYAHFPSKDDMVAELERQGEQLMSEQVRSRLSDATTVGEIFAGAIGAIFDLVAGTDPIVRREVYAYLMRQPEGTDWLAYPLVEFVTERVAAAQARGEIPDDPPASELTQLVMITLLGFLVIESRDPAEQRAAALRTIDLLLRGLRP